MFYGNTLTFRSFPVPILFSFTVPLKSFFLEVLSYSHTHRRLMHLPFCISKSKPTYVSVPLFSEQLHLTALLMSPAGHVAPAEGNRSLTA